MDLIEIHAGKSTGFCRCFFSPWSHNFHQQTLQSPDSSQSFCSSPKKGQDFLNHHHFSQFLRHSQTVWSGFASQFFPPRSGLSQWICRVVLSGGTLGTELVLVGTLADLTVTAVTVTRAVVCAARAERQTEWLGRGDGSFPEFLGCFSFVFETPGVFFLNVGFMLFPVLWRYIFIFGMG